MSIRLRQIENGDYQQLFATNCGISRAEHGGEDPDTFCFVRVEYTDEWGDHPEYKYHASIVACGPGWPSDESLQSALNTIGMGLAEFRSFPIQSQCQILIDCGVMATLWQQGGNNLAKLLAHAREELASLRVLVGFRLDSPQNAIGSSGWDFMRGEVLAGIGR